MSYLPDENQFSFWIGKSERDDTERDLVESVSPRELMVSADVTHKLWFLDGYVCH